MANDTTDIQIAVVKRPHRWMAKRGSNVTTCQTCGVKRSQVATMVCFEEEIEINASTQQTQS